MKFTGGRFPFALKRTKSLSNDTVYNHLKETDAEAHRRIERKKPPCTYRLITLAHEGFVFVEKSLRVGAHIKRNHQAKG